MATVQAFPFSRVENIYTMRNPSSESSRKNRKTHGLLSAKTPYVLSSSPVVDTLACRETDRKKSFSKNGTAAESMVSWGENFGNFVDQISASLHRKNWEETREIMKLKSMKKDKKAFVVAEVLKLETDAKKALCFFHWAEKLEEYEHLPISYCIIIDKLRSSHMLDAAEGIIEQMKNNRILIDASVFLIFIKWYGKLRKAKDALYIFVSMKNEGHIPGKKTYNAILVALVRAKEFKMAINIHAEMLGYKVAMNSVTFATMIECLCLGNKVREARDMLYDMLDKGHSPSVVTYAQLITAFCKRRNISQAFDILGKMQEQGCSPDLITYNAIMRGLCLEGKVEEALTWLQKMPSKDCTPNMVSYAYIIDGLGKVGRTDKAKQLVSEAIGKGLAPNIFIYNALFNGYFREGRPDDALDLFYEISQKSVNPNRQSYTILIHGLNKWKRIPEALALKDDMQVKGYNL